MAQLFIPLAISTGLNLLASLFTPKPQEQEVDLRVPRSDYGSPLVKFYGQVRIEGNKFWPDTKERMYRKVTSSNRNNGKGGLGGGKRGETRTEYFGTFAVLFCQGSASMKTLIVNGDQFDTSHPFYGEYVTFFKGDQESPWSEMVAKDDAPFKDIAYTNICYVGFTDLPLEKYGNQIPQQISAVLVDEELGINPRLQDVIVSICERAGIEQSLLDVSGLGEMKLDGGMVVPESGEGYRKVLEDLFQMFMITAIETREGKIKFVRLDASTTGVGVNLKDFFPVSANGIENKILTRSEVNPTQLPTQLTIKYSNIDKQYNTDEVSVYAEEMLELVDTSANNWIKENVVTVDTKYFGYPDKMQVSAQNLLLYLHKQQKYEYNVKLPATALSGVGIEPLSIISLPNNEAVQIESIAVGNDYLLDIKGRYFSDVEYVEPPLPPTPTPPPEFNLDIPELFVLDIPTFRENTLPGTLYIFARKPCTVLVSIDGGASYLREVNHEGVSTYGNVLSVLPNGSGLDEVNTVDIELESGEVNSITTAQLTANLNLAVIGTLVSGVYQGEIIQFRDVEILTATTFRLSYLKRGLFNTQRFNGSHALPQKFFLLTAESNAYYSELRGESQFLGETLTLLPVVSPFQNLATTTTYTVTPIGNSYRPPAPTNLSGRITPDENITYRWNYNPTFSPFNNSQESVTFEVEILDDETVVRTLTTDIQSVVYTAIDRTDDGLPTTITIRVYAVSSIVGRGDGAEAEIIPDSVGFDDQRLRIKVDSELYDFRNVLELLSTDSIEIESGINSEKVTISPIVNEDYLDEFVEDKIVATLTAGSNITLSYNSEENSLTISSSGGGTSEVSIEDIWLYSG